MFGIVQYVLADIHLAAASLAVCGRRGSQTGYVCD